MAALVLCLFSSSCTSLQGPCWQCDQIHSPISSCELSQKRINIGPQFLPIEVEVVNGRTGRYVYLNGTNVIFPKASTEVEEGVAAVEVELTIAEKSYTFLAKRFSGGQRLLLPDGIADLLLSALENNEAIMVGYQKQMRPSL